MAPKTLVDYSAQLAHVAPRKLAQEINKAHRKGEELFQVAVPYGQGLRVVNGKIEKVSDKSQIQFYDYVIVSEDKFLSWAEKLQGSRTRNVADVLEIDPAKVMELASDPDALEKYLERVARAKANGGKGTGDAKESWASFHAGNADLLKSSDTEAIEQAIETLTSRTKGKGGYKGENRKAAEKFLKQLQERVQELGDSQEQETEQE